VNHISEQIRKQSSEYRLLPELPPSSADMAKRALLASPDATMNADSLRKADGLTVMRLGFALLLSDLESYERDLVPSAWPSVRKEFYGLIFRHILGPEHVFQMFSYLHRVLALMVATGDFSDANDLLSALVKCLDLIEDTSRKADMRNFPGVREYFHKAFKQAALQASTSKQFSTNHWEPLRKLIIRLDELFSSETHIYLSKPNLKALKHDLTLSDLGRRSYKDYWYYEQEHDGNDSNVPTSEELRKVIRLDDINRFRMSAELKKAHWPALAFPTRPLTFQEIALISPSVLNDSAFFKASVKALRGAGLADTRVNGVIMGDENNVKLHIPTVERGGSKVKFALTNFLTTDEQWQASVSGKPDRSLKRYERINKLTNQILREQGQVDYLIFPEFSVPRRWAFGLASKLAKNGISFIAGLEYHKANRGAIRLKNIGFLSLITNWPNYMTSLVYLQHKAEPAHSEKKSVGLRKLYKPTAEEGRQPIFVHGNHEFGLLMCSDLTNPKNRNQFQGKIDSLIVLEWNKDVKTFDFLVEASAHDIHCAVIQVNNRLYGDSRIRVPFRKDFQRDVVRVKGGETDYYVLGEFDFDAIRKYQSKRDFGNTEAPFKPPPTGFKVSKSRERT
jgi:hypothetical protein